MVDTLSQFSLLESNVRQNLDEQLEISCYFTLHIDLSSSNSLQLANSITFLSLFYKHDVIVQT